MTGVQVGIRDWHGISEEGRFEEENVPHNYRGWLIEYIRRYTINEAGKFLTGEEIYQEFSQWIRKEARG